MTEKPTEPELIDATVMDHKEVYVKVFYNKGKTKYCAELSTGKYVVCNIKDPDPCLDTTVFDQKPKEFILFDFFTLEHLQYSDFRWLFYAIAFIPDHNDCENWEDLFGDCEEDSFHFSSWAADGWQIVFPISNNKLYLHNPPMFYTQRKTQ